MDFKQKKDRLDDFDYNVKHCLRNEITSKSTVIDEIGVDNIDDAGRLFNFACTKIMFKNYLEDNTMKVCELQVILNDVYLSFVNDVTSNKPNDEKNSAKKSSRKTTVGAETKNNTFNKVVSSNDDGVVKDSKKTKQKLKNNISNKVVFSNDDVVDKDSKKN